MSLHLSSFFSSALNLTMVTMEGGNNGEQDHKPEAGGDPWNGAAEAAGTPGASAGFEDDFSPAAAAGARPEEDRAGVRGDLERLPDSEEYLAGLEAK